MFSKANCLLISWMPCLGIKNQIIIYARDDHRAGTTRVLTFRSLQHASFIFFALLSDSEKYISL